jgi:glycyl-tRNA synthetase alpha subunit
MKVLKIMLACSFLLPLVSCNLNFTTEKDSKMKKEIVDGVEYTFVSNSSRREVKFLFFEARQFDFQVYFDGLDQPIQQTLSWGDFEEKLEKPDYDFVLVDSLSFLVSDAKDQVDLTYHLRFMGEQQSLANVSFQVNKTNNSWVIQ